MIQFPCDYFGSEWPGTNEQPLTTYQEWGIVTGLAMLLAGGSCCYHDVSSQQQNRTKTEAGTGIVGH